MSIHTGAATVTPEQYVEAVAALQPDLWVALSDDIPNDSRSDRCAKSVDRTAAWLPACMAAAAASPALAGAGALAAVQGGQYVNERMRCAEVRRQLPLAPVGAPSPPGTTRAMPTRNAPAGLSPRDATPRRRGSPYSRCLALPLQAAAAQPGLAGVVVAALGTGESPELRATIVREVTARFPEGALRMLSSVGTPEEVLEAVAQVGVAGLAWETELRGQAAASGWWLARRAPRVACRRQPMAPRAAAPRWWRVRAAPRCSGRQLRPALPDSPAA